MGQVQNGPLVLVALRQEAMYLDQIPHALIGVGKVSAAVGTARALAEHRPSQVLNIGTAGALHAGYAGLYRVGRVLEHDFDRVSLEALTGDPFPGDIVLDESEPTVLATGDRFIQEDALRQRLAAKAHLVDMEGYAVARVCAAFGMQLTMLKIVSDEASETALRSWQDAVEDSARAIAEAALRWCEV